MSTTDHEEIENVLLQAAQSVILIARAGGGAGR
jgi:hypothetical protein